MKLFKKVFVCVVAVCTMTTITNASNMDFISKDSVAYTVNGIDAYNAPRDAAKNFDVERVTQFRWKKKTAICLNCILRRSRMTALISLLRAATIQ